MVDGGPACSFHHSIISERIKNQKRRRLNDTVDLASTESKQYGYVPSIHNVHEVASQHGLFPGTVLEVSGPPSSGKTQLALTIVANAILSDKPWSVRYLLGGSVALTSLARRLRQICHCRVNKTGVSKITMEHSLDCVSFYPLSDMFQLLATLTSIEEELVTTGSDCTHKNILIVLDSVAGVFLSSAPMDSNSDGGSSGALLSTAALTLRRLSRSGMIPVDEITDFNIQQVRQCAVLVTNGTVSGRIKVSTSSGYFSYSKPALGKLWKIADIRLALEIEGDDYSQEASVATHDVSCKRRVRVHLIKHWLKNSKVPGPNARIGLDRSGVVDA
jgi:hypothetical protein